MMNRRVKSNTVTKVAFIVGLIALVSITGYTQADRANKKIEKASSNALKADVNCNAYNVAGTYGYTATGTVVVATPFGTPPVPAAEVGTFVLNSDGTFTITRSIQNINGFIIPSPPVTGTFTVNADCTIDATNQFGDGFFGVFVDDRQEIRYTRVSTLSPPEPGRLRGVVIYIAKRM